MRSFYSIPADTSRCYATCSLYEVLNLAKLSGRSDQGKIPSGQDMLLSCRVRPAKIQLTKNCIEQLGRSPNDLPNQWHLHESPCSSFLIPRCFNHLHLFPNSPSPLKASLMVSTFNQSKNKWTGTNVVQKGQHYDYVKRWPGWNMLKPLWIHCINPRGNDPLWWPVSAKGPGLFTKLSSNSCDCPQLHSNKRKWSRKWYSVSFQVQTAELDWGMSKQSALYKTTTKLHGESEDFHHIIHPFCLWWSVKTQAVKHGSKIDEWISKSRISFQLLHCMGCVSDSGLHLCKGLVVAGPRIQLPKTISVDVW